MSLLANGSVKNGLKRPGLAAVAAIAVGAMTLSPASARVFVGIGVPVGWGYYAPPAYYYPPPPPPAAYYGGGCGYGFRFVPAHYDRFGRWIPGHCRPW